MLDHATLSASQGPSTRSSQYGLKDTEETPIVVSDLSASVSKLHKNSFTAVCQKIELSITACFLQLEHSHSDRTTHTHLEW